jgi:glycosyltransferase involved in cell wall biosynthesis
VAEIISERCDLEGHVLAPEGIFKGPAPPTFWRCGPETGTVSTPLTVHRLPAQAGNAERFGFEPRSLRRFLRKLKPDYIWIHEEFWQGMAQQFLWHYRFDAKVRIIAYAAINHAAGPTPLVSARWPFLSRTRLKQWFLWPRLDGVAACATKSMKCARRMGLTETVPITVNYLPVFGPEEAGAESVSLPWSRDGSCIIGFAGLLSQQKGWKVLLAAVQELPERFKVVIAGDGEQRAELLTWLERPELRGRVLYAGFLGKEKLLATYPICDVVVLPSVTTPDFVEQFGAVLAEAMACGVPVIGSDSGAIPETVGEAGLIVPESDPQALADAIRKICEDQELRGRAVACGRGRFRTHYSCESYAHSIAQALKMV